MRTHKSYEDMSDCELNNHYQTIFVTSYVKDIILVPNVVCCGKVYLYIRQVFPFCLFCDVIPSFKCSQSISMSF